MASLSRAKSHECKPIRTGRLRKLSKGANRQKLCFPGHTRRHAFPPNTSTCQLRLANTVDL